MAPIPKWIRPWARRTELTKEIRPRLAIIESIMIRTAPKWDVKKWRFIKACTLIEACESEGISDVTFRNWRNEDKKIGDYIENMKRARKEMLHTMMEQSALDNVMEWINWDVKLRPMDKINLSMRYLEKTSAEFNPAIKLDVENAANPILSMNKQEMEQRILELSAKLNLKTNITLYDNGQSKWTIQLPSSNDATIPQEQIWHWEVESI